MKRTALRRRTWLNRSSGSSLKRRPPRRIVGVPAFAWRRDLGPCVVCPVEGGTCRGPVQGHHIVPKQKLLERGLDAHIDDLRNRLPVCEHRHEQHTVAYRPIPRVVLPPAAFEFADEFGLGWYLDRHYPFAIVEAVA